MSATPSWSVRCRAWARQAGRPCRNWACRGAEVCRMHGGRAPQVRAKAVIRLAEAKAERRLGRGLTVVERSMLTGDSSPLHRKVRDLLTEIRADELTTPDPN